MKLTKGTRIIICLVLMLIICITQYFGLFKKIEYQIDDILYQTGTKIHEKIFVIGIDEETLSRYGAFDTWSRDKIADLINLLSQSEYAPKVIAVDIGFYGTKANDQKLVDAAKKAGNVVLTSSMLSTNTVNGYEVILVEEPFDDLKNACYAYGFSNLIFDDDGVVRHSANDILYEGKPYYSFDNRIVEAYLGKNVEDIDQSFYISYSSKSHAYYGSTGAGCSFCKVLEGEYPLDDFKDAIVLIGAYASGTQIITIHP